LLKLSAARPLPGQISARILAGTGPGGAKPVGTQKPRRTRRCLRIPDGSASTTGRC